MIMLAIIVSLATIAVLWAIPLMPTFKRDNFQLPAGFTFSKCQQRQEIEAPQAQPDAKLETEPYKSVVPTLLMALETEPYKSVVPTLLMVPITNPQNVNDNGVWADIGIWIDP